MPAWDEEPIPPSMAQVMDVHGGWDDVPAASEKTTATSSGFDGSDAPPSGKQVVVVSVSQDASRFEDWGAPAEPQKVVSTVAAASNADDGFDGGWDAPAVTDTVAAPVAATVAAPADDPFDGGWDVPTVTEAVAAVDLTDAPAAGGVRESATAYAPDADPYAAKGAMGSMGPPLVPKKGHVIREDLTEKADGKNFADSFIPQLSAQYDEPVIDERKSDDTLPTRRQDVSWIYGKNTEEMIRKSSKTPAPAEENRRSQKSYIHYNGNRNTANHEWTNFQVRYLIALMAKSYHEYGDRAADESYKDKKQRIERKRQFNKSLGVADDATMRHWAFQDVTESLNMWCISANDDEISAQDVKEMIYRLVIERKGAYKFTQAQDAGGRLTRTIAMVWKKRIDFDGSMKEWDNGREAALEAKRAQDEESDRNPAAVGAVSETTNVAGIQTGWNGGGDADAENITAAASIDDGMREGGGAGGGAPAASVAVNDDDDWGSGGFASAAAPGALPVRSREPDPFGDPLPSTSAFGRTAATGPTLGDDLGDAPVAVAAVPLQMDDDWVDSVGDVDIAITAAPAPERVREPDPFGNPLPTKKTPQSTTLDGSSKRPGTGDPAFHGFLGTIIQGVLGESVDATLIAAGNDGNWSGGVSVPAATATADTPDDEWGDSAPAAAASLVPASVQAEAFLDSMTEFNSGPVFQTGGGRNENDFGFGFRDTRAITPKASQPAAKAPPAFDLDPAYEIDPVTGLNPARMAMITFASNQPDSPPLSEPAMPCMPSDVPDEPWVPGQVQYITNRPKISGFNTAPLPFNRLAGEKRPDGYVPGKTAPKSAPKSAPQLDNPNISWNDGADAGAVATATAVVADSGASDGGAEWGAEDGDASKENKPAKPRYADPDAANDAWSDNMELDY